MYRTSMHRCAHVVAMALLISSTTQAQYNGPESVEYDPVGDRYFVSNTQSQTIKARAQDGTVSTFANVGAAPYGLEIMADTLYACVGGRVKGYALANASQVFDLDLGAGFLNGITTDGEHLYCTDFSTGRVYKVNPQTTSFEVLVATTNGTPNGIVWDPTGQRLVVVFWGANAPIKAFDRNSGVATTLVANSGVGSIDGVTIDCHGNFLVASWNPARITRFDPAFATPGVNTGIAPLSNPADIDFDTVHARVCIPNSGSNSVLLAEVDCATGIAQMRRYTTRVYPNPTPGLVRFDPPMAQAEPYLVLDVRGRLQATGTLRAKAAMDLSNLPDGLYTIVFSRLAEEVRVVKD